MAPQKGPKKGAKKALCSASRIVQKSAPESAPRIVPKSAPSSASSSAQERADRAARRVENKDPNTALYTAAKVVKEQKKMQKMWSRVRKMLKKIIGNKTFECSTTFALSNLIEKLEFGIPSWSTVHDIQLTHRIIKLCKALSKGDNPREPLEVVLSHNTWPLFTTDERRAHLVSAKEISGYVSGVSDFLRFEEVLRTIIGHQYVEAGTELDLLEFLA